MKGVPYKKATYYADGVYGPDDLAAVWNACVNAHKALAQQPAAVVGVEQVASAIAIEDTGVSWHDVSPRDRTHYVKLARAALAAQKGGAA